MASAAILPITKSIFLCDNVSLNHQTAKVSVEGLFNAVTVEFRANAVSVLDEFCVFAEFIGGVSHATVHLEFVQSGTNRVVFQTPQRTLLFPGRRSALAVSFRVTNFMIAEPGVYLVELYCNDTCVDDRALEITAREENWP